MRRDRMGWLPRRIASRCAAIEVRSRWTAALSRGAGFLLAAQRLEFFSPEEAMDQERQLRSLLALPVVSASAGNRPTIRCCRRVAPQHGLLRPGRGTAQCRCDLRYRQAGIPLHHLSSVGQVNAELSLSNAREV